MKPIAVRRKCQDGGCAFETVGAEILAGKLSLPGVGHMLAAGDKFVAPGIFRTIETATSGEFPFSFGRKLLSGPLGVSFHVAIRDMDDRMIVETADR